MLTTILVILVVVIAMILLLAASKPNSYRVERSGTIQAPPERIFPLINDFRNWPQWSPWEKLDPAMKKDLGGPPSGVGSSYAWEGNSKAGKGRMEITESNPPTRVKLNLNFVKPFKSDNVTEFNLQPRDTGTHVHWTMNGPAPMMTKVMMVFMNMDKMIGRDFDEGLANLKRVAETSAP